MIKHDPITAAFELRYTTHSAEVFYVTFLTKLFPDLFITFDLQNKNRQVNFELWKEAQAYGDIQFMPFVDYYSLISLKTVAICIMGVS